MPLMGYGKHAKTAWFIAPDNQPLPVFNDYYFIQYLFYLYSDRLCISQNRNKKHALIHCHWIGFEDAEIKALDGIPCNEFN